MSSQNPNVTSPDPTKFKTEADGSFKRVASAFRNLIEPGGKFEPEAGRYILYVSPACPWAHRTLIARKIKGLDDIIRVITVSPRLGANGWPFANVDPYDGADVDTVNHADYMKDLYHKANPEHLGRPSVPVLWDTKTSTIVNNESSEIIRIFNTAFNALLPQRFAQVDLYPESLRQEIDSINEWVYETVNNGVYKSGIATSQAAYETAVKEVFDSLDRLEGILKGKDFLVGSQLIEADIRLYVTIARFDVVYFSLFKCNLRTIRDGYPEIHRWLRKLYWNNEAFNSTTNFDHIKTHYWWSLAHINPSRVIPAGPVPSICPL